ncbi:MAG: dihydroneopterin aldolase [Bacteroidales bacterium]|nr:dihydroneopterin aldolase [Bacteroidales bacterium]
MSMIAVEGMEFYSYHGCFKEEKEIGTHFIVDFYFSNDTNRAEITDDLKETISYLDVYQLIKKEMAVSSDLLEHVARRILKVTFASFDSMEWAKVKIQKMNPPLGGKMKSVSFSLEEKR